MNLPLFKATSECICWLSLLVFGSPEANRCDVEVVDELFLFICLELPDTLEAFEVDEATELEEDILDNVESVETGDIVDVLPKPPPITPPVSF